jgi:hypothetical protein
MLTIGQMARWAPKPVWSLGKRNISRYCREPNHDAYGRPARSLFTKIVTYATICCCDPIILCMRHMMRAPSASEQHYMEATPKGEITVVP